MSEIRFVSINRTDAEVLVEADEVLPINTLSNIVLEEEEKSRVIAHREVVPVAVAVGSGRSPGTRALVGGAILGPIGAIVGGMSGIAVK